MIGPVILLDTHIVLWALQDPARLGRARNIIAAADRTRYLSAACVWEVAIKSRLGRLDLQMSVNHWVGRAADDLAAERLPITDEHAAAVADLPDHHRDPFDRMLVAQARVLGAPIVTADQKIGLYDVDTISV